MTSFGVANNGTEPETSGLGAVSNPATDLNDYNSSMRIRDIVVNIATSLINQLRPLPQVGRVQSVDTTTKTASVTLANDSTPVSVRYMTSADKPNGPGDIVEVSSSLGQKRISKLLYSSLGDPLVDGHDVGEVVMGGWLTTPTWGLLCDGAAYSRALYSRLFARIGTQYGAGDGSTTFNMPNYMAGSGDINRFPIGGVGNGSKGGVTAHDHTQGSLTAAVHNHQLNGTGFAAVTFDGTGTQQGRMLRAGGISWVSNIGLATTTAGVLATGQTSGAQLLGATNNSAGEAVSGITDIASFYPPWQGLTIVIKY